MSYEERGQWVYIGAIVLTFGAYVAIVLPQAGRGAVTEIDYVPTMLWSIGIGIALSIAGRILAEIVGEMARPGETHEPDVRDRDIGRLGEYFGGTVLSVAMIAPFGMALAELEHFWIANAIYAAFVLSALIGAVVKIVAYRRGF